MEIYGVFIGREIKFPGLSHSNSSLLYSLNTEEKCQFIERKIKALQERMYKREAKQAELVSQSYHPYVGSPFVDSEDRERIKRLQNLLSRFKRELEPPIQYTRLRRSFVPPEGHIRTVYPAGVVKVRDIGAQYTKQMDVPLGSTEIIECIIHSKLELLAHVVSQSNLEALNATYQAYNTLYSHFIGSTALHISIAIQNFPAVKILLSDIRVVEARLDKNRLLPIFIALKHDYSNETLSWLLQLFHATNRHLDIKDISVLKKCYSNVALDECVVPKLVVTDHEVSKSSSLIATQPSFLERDGGIGSLGTRSSYPLLGLLRAAKQRRALFGDVFQSFYSVVETPPAVASENSNKQWDEEALVHLAESRLEFSEQEGRKTKGEGLPPL